MIIVIVSRHFKILLLLEADIETLRCTSDIILADDYQTFNPKKTKLQNCKFTYISSHLKIVRGHQFKSSMIGEEITA